MSSATREKTMWDILGWIVAGLIIGAIARFLVAGKQPMGWIMTILLGIAGSFVGGGISYLIWGSSPDPFTAWPSYIMSILGAVILLAVYVAWTRRRAP